MAEIHLSTAPVSRNDKAMGQNPVTDLRDAAIHATRLESVLDDVRSIIEAIDHGRLLDHLPADIEEVQRHNTATSLLSIARRRLEEADEIPGTDLSIKLHSMTDALGYQPTSRTEATVAASPDAEILSAWEAYKAARNDLAAMDDASPDGSTDADSAIWQKVDDAEKVICAAQAKTLQGIQCQLATALYHFTSGRELSRAVLAGDFDRLSQAEKGFDWPVQLLFAAIKGIRAMQPA